MQKIYNWDGVEYGSAEYQRLWRLANKEHSTEYHRNYDKKMYILHSERENARRNRYMAKYPHKTKAHQSVYRAIKSGKLIKLPCQQCGVIKSVAHHIDYTKPLDVMWLCQLHHKQWHTNNS